MKKLFKFEAIDNDEKIVRLYYTNYKTLVNHKICHN